MDIILNLNDISQEEGQGLVELAKNSIKYYLQTGKIPHLKEIPFENWKKKGATFVTLERRDTGALRGCIGSIIPFRPLYEDTISNAIAAATKDPRFTPVKLEELPYLKTKVSILSYPVPLEYKDYQDLLNKVKPFEDGLILKLGNYQGTFLPAVWEDLPDKEQFLAHLCLKAGLEPDCILKYHPEIFVYKTREFSD
jgi:AmmeMemoRadiSam system protein A